MNFKRELAVLFCTSIGICSQVMPSVKLPAPAVRAVPAAPAPAAPVLEPPVLEAPARKEHMPYAPRYARLAPASWPFLSFPSPAGGRG